MGKKSDPPKVNKQAYNALLAQSTAAAKTAAANSAAQLAWAQQAYAQDRALAQPIITAALTRMGVMDAQAAADRSRAAGFNVAEDKILSDAMSWDSPERMAQAEGAAMSDVYGAMEGSRQASQQALEGYGVDPSATRIGAIDIAQRSAAAAAAVAAANRAAIQTQQQAQALRTQAAQIGQITANRGLQEATLAGQQGAGALGASLATTASGAASMGMPTQYASLENQAIGGASNVLSQQQQALMDRFNAKTAQQSVLANAAGTALGTAAGAALGGGFNPMSMFGSAAPAIGAPTMPATYAAGGGEVSAALSPSGGARTDDVPIMANAGEFIIPKDIVGQKGEEFFHRLIQTTRKNMNNRGAIPTRMAA
jgi:hypothetical protein